MFKITAKFQNGIKKSYLTNSLSKKSFWRIINEAEDDDIDISIVKINAEGKRLLLYDSNVIKKLMEVLNEEICSNSISPI